MLKVLARLLPRPAGTCCWREGASTRCARARSRPGWRCCRRTGRTRGHDRPGPGRARPPAAPALVPGLEPRGRGIVEEAMRATGVLDLADTALDELSGGQRQRAWIAMALARQTPRTRPSWSSSAPPRR
ncbi:hypothetical protein [Actinomadura chokoriensis]|uniref:ATP-binding cassette domain-containing protein n=1 Tax=Actinomadura chokoriensis TaxID=454156 RepID=A0ABV4QUD6_9ACTN